MRKSRFSALVVFFLSSLALAADDESPPASCADFSVDALTEGKPVIRVEPAFGEQLRNDSTESCVIVIYGLKEKRGTEGHALLARRAKAVAWSEEVPRSARRAAERAMSKWLFFSRMHDASDERIYYSLFTF